MATNKTGNKKSVNSTSRQKSDYIKHSDTGSSSRESRPQGRATNTPPAPSPGHKK